MKTALNWLRVHLVKVLGAVVVLLAVVGLWTGQLPVDTGSLWITLGLGLLGISVRLDQVHAAAIAKAGADYRAGDIAGAVAELKPAFTDGAIAIGAQVSPLTLTLSGEAEHVLAAATSLQSTPAKG